MLDWNGKWLRHSQGGGERSGLELGCRGNVGKEYGIRERSGDKGTVLD